MRGSISWVWVVGGLVVVAGGILALVIAHTEALPRGPEPVVWDRTPCSECGMAVSEKGFAAQLQITDGEVLDFDDPGCLFQYLSKASPKVHEIYFHHVREDRWIRRDRAAFIVAGPSPMGYDLGAVDIGKEGAVSFEQAMRQATPATRGGVGADR